MSTTSIEAMVDSFVKRAIVEPRTRGGQETEVESASLLESIALALLLTPKTALYFAFLARNKLVAAASAELTALEALRSAIGDLGNVTYAVRDTRSLERARVALLQIESSDHLSVRTGSFRQFESAVNDFVNKQLAQNVRRAGRSDLVRPGLEAKGEIPGLFTALQEAHADFLDRLYALEVGIDNFLSSPFGTIIGLATVARVRHDMAEIIQSFQDDPSAVQSRDAVFRLMSAKAAVSLLGSAPDITQPVLSSSQKLPAGLELTGKSVPAAAIATSTAGPWVFPTAASFEINATGPAFFPQTDVDNQNAAVIVGDLKTFPISIDPDESLFLRLASAAAYDATFTVQPDGTYTSSVLALGDGWTLNTDGIFEKTVRLNLNPSLTASSISFAACLSLLSTSWPGSAIEYVGPSLSGRVMLRAETDFGYLRSFTVVPSFAEVDPLSTVDAVRVFTKSVHAKLGLSLGQTGTAGSTAVSFVVDALNAVFPSVLTAQRTADGAVQLTSVDTEPGALLGVSGTAPIGLSGTYLATSDTFQLFGSVQGVDDGFPVSPVDIVDVSDIVLAPTGIQEIVSLTSTSVVLENPVPTFDGQITVESSLFLTWVDMAAALHPLVEVWLNGAFAANLDVLDRAIAPLRGTASPSQQTAAQQVLGRLEDDLSAVVTALTAPDTILPAGAGEAETIVGRGILSALAERHYDRAADLLSRCQIREVLSLDWQTASFGGAFLQATSDFARSDMKFVNKAKDEGNKADAIEERTEFPP